MLQHSSTASFVWGAQFEVVGYDAARPALTNFPVLVRIANDSPSGFSYSQMQLRDGADIRFTDAGGNLIPHEIDTWDTSGESLVWVRLPALADGATFKMYYGSDAPGVPSDEDVWTRYAAVIHGGDSITNAVAGGPTASTPSSAAQVAAAADAGKVGGGIHKEVANAIGVNVSMGNPASSLASTNQFSVSGWFKRNGKGGKNNGTHVLAASRSGWSSGTGFLLLQEQGKYVDVAASGSHQWSSGSYKLEDGVWAHVAFSYEKDVAIKSYFNGAQDQTKASPSNLVSSVGTWTFGSYANTASDDSFRGDMDELRIFDGVASGDWIKAEHDTVANVAFLSAGAVQLADPDAPTVSVPSIIRNADGTFTVSVVVSSNNAASVSCVLDGGATFPMTTADTSLPKTYVTTLAGLPASTTLVYSVQAQSIGGGTIGRTGAETFHTGDLSVEKIADGDEDGLVPGVFRISRADTGPALSVAFTLGGTAEEGVSYRTMAHTATIPAGTNAVDVIIQPLIDPLEQSRTVELTLSPGLYGISSSAGSALLTITNLELPANRNTWIAEGAGLASASTNWSFGHAPRAGEHVLFDGRFSSADCEWDAAATHEVAAWTQNNGYTGTVTVCTVFPGKGDFECLVVAGAMTIDAGSLTHPQSRTMTGYHREDWDWLGDLKANETYRLRISAGSLHVGAGGLIDARGKGYYVTDGGSRMKGCSHGGRLSADSPPCYGDPCEPVHIGLPFHAGSNKINGKGGGAVYLTVAGVAVVDGTIRVDAWDASSGFDKDGDYAGAMGAAGSIFIRADTLSGTGRITAMGTGPNEEGITYESSGFNISTEGHYKGTGGRIAIVTREPVDRSTFGAISAEGSWMGTPANSWVARRGGGSGTVVFIDETRPNGLLVVAQQANASAPSLDPSYPTFWRCPAVTDEGDWTFDAIEFGHRGFLRVPEGMRLTLPGGLASCYGTEASVDALGGLRYEGGTLDIGDGDQTISGNWMFVPWTNFVFGGSVTVSNGAAIGFHPLTDNRDTGAGPAVFPICSAEIRGDLTIATNGYLRATDCGVVKESETNEIGFASPLFGSHSHGGRSLYLGRDPDGRMVSQAYDSVFDPHLPGCSAVSISGQQCGGVIRLVVDGTLTLDGTATVSGGPAERASSSKPVAGGAGGALSLAAGRFAGVGTIQANGGNRDDYDGPGGRIAIRLSAPGADFSGFTGCIEAGGGSWWKGGTNVLHDASAGTVYLETADDGDRGGTIRIAMDPLNIAYILGTKDKRTPHDNTNTTEMVSLGYGGDDPRDYKHVRYVIADYGRAAVNADVKVRSVLLADDTAALDLEGHELTVKEFYWVSGADVGTATNHLRSGEYSAAQLSELGISSVEDSSPEKSGKIVVNRGKLTLTIR